MTTDPYAPHLRQADDLFAKGDIVKAGQIWQAILKQQPSHTAARERLLAVKQHLLALREAEAAAQAAPPAPPPVPAPEAAPEPAALAAPEPPPAPEPLPPIPEPVPAPVAADPRSTSPEAALAAPEPPKVTTGHPDPERLLAEGCTLYDMGQLQDALKKWEQVLTLDPAHALARGYANGARRELGLGPIHAEPTPVPPSVADHHADEDIDKLLREAVQLYDMGLTEEAITKWERILALEPERHEIAGYLREARREVGQATSAAAAPVTTPTAPVEPDNLDLKLRQAEHLLGLQRHEEAAFTFQQALQLAPGNARALNGLERCRKPASPPAPEARSTAPVMTLDTQGRIAMADEDRSNPGDPQGVEPPAALQLATPAPRLGPSLPDRLREATEQLPWLKEPKFLAAIGGGLLTVIVVLALVHGYRKDQALKEEVRAARTAAVAPVAQQAQAPDLAESPAAIRQEVEIALGTDPLRAYLRAEALLRLNPNDATGAQLLEKARAGLPGGASGASLPEFQKHLQNGDLEAARKVMDALLRAQPDSADLRSRAARLHLTLCFAHASQAKWDEAEEDLLRGRALFPGDKTWQVRLKLLEKVKALPKNQQAAWIPLLS